MSDPTLDEAAKAVTDIAGAAGVSLAPEQVNLAAQLFVILVNGLSGASWKGPDQVAKDAAATVKTPEDAAAEFNR